MDADYSELLSLPPAEQLRIVEMLWDNLGATKALIPLPKSVQAEALRRMEEMKSDSTIGLSHEEVWSKIERRVSSQPTRGVGGLDLLKFVGTIDEADLDAMSQAIEDGCG